MGSFVDRDEQADERAPSAGAKSLCIPLDPPRTRRLLRIRPLAGATRPPSMLRDLVRPLTTHAPSPSNPLIPICRELSENRDGGGRKRDCGLAGPRIRFMTITPVQFIAPPPGSVVITYRRPLSIHVSLSWYAHPLCLARHYFPFLTLSLTDNHTPRLV
jgi:hypothetical protein